MENNLVIGNETYPYEAVLKALQLPTTISKTDFEKFRLLCVKKNLNPFKSEIYAVSMGGKIAPIVNYITLTNRVKEKYPNLNEVWDYKFDSNDNLKAVVLKLTQNGNILAQQLVYLNEYASNTPIWKSKPNTMLQKVARAQCYRMIDTDFSDMYISEEMNGQESKKLVEKPIGLDNTDRSNESVEC